MRPDMNNTQIGHFGPSVFIENVLAGMAAFVAPIVAAGAAAAAVSQPGADVFKVVARLRHPSRFSKSAREAMLEAAERQGLTLEEAIRALSLSDKEMEAVKEIVERREVA